MHVEGTVITGTGVAGSRLGCPTANLQIDVPNCVLPGVYAAHTTLPDATCHHAVAYYGDTPGKFEVHLLDWHGDLRGARIVVELLDRIGECVPWQSEEQMREKIKDDLHEARRFFVDDSACTCENRSTSP